MKRLHEVLDTLADPGKRRAYDESLMAAAYADAGLHWPAHADPEPPVQPQTESRLAQLAVKYWAWILIGCMILGGGYWCVTAYGPAQATVEPNEYPAESPSSAMQPPETPPRRGMQAQVKRSGLSHAAESALPGELPAAGGASPGLPALTDAPASAPPALPVLPPVVASATALPPSPSPANAPPVPSARKSSFAGEWFYAPAVDKPDPHLYAPTEIDLKLTEESGSLGGLYRGRYKVPDRAVSQDVVFRIQGKASSGTSAALTWTSTDGAAGEIDLNLSQPDLMKVTWWTTKPGTRPALSSGAATLVRQQEP